MAGENITNQFNIGTATVMIGPMDKVFDLTPEEHSIGLVKNFTVTSQKTYTELTAGTQSVVVDAQVTGNEITTSMEVYEYTASNLAYGLGLDGSEYVTGEKFKLGAEVTGGVSATTITIAATEDISSSFAAGQLVEIQNSTDNRYDAVLVREVASATYSEGTLTVTLTEAIPTGWTFKEGDMVYTINFIPVASGEAQPFLGAKVVGILPNGNEPVTIIFPKIRITNGFSVGFQADTYSNLPFEFKPYALTTDDPLYATYKNKGMFFVDKR